MTFTSNRMALEIPPQIKSNRLYYGDNLTIMKDYIAPASVDLIYLDPPFNSQRNYNLIYKKLTGQPVPEQEEAFCDAWEMDPEKVEMMQRMPIVYKEYGVDEDLARFWDAWIKALRNTQPRLLAYLLYMTVRLFEMRRILSSRGSIYLHCDPHASHYMKVIMDGVFGHSNFRNEIIWKRTHAHGSAKRWGDVHDVLLFYTKTDDYIWNKVPQRYEDSYLKTKYRFSDNRGVYRLVVLTAPGTTGGESGKPWQGYDPSAAGRHWAVPKRALEMLRDEGIAIPASLHEQLDLLLKHDLIRFPKKKDGSNGVPEFKLYRGEGSPVQDIITDISPVNSQAKERLGYPTQKPIALVERIIRSSSNPNGVVFDPFCGCGTAIYAAHLAGRKWIGCDIAILSIHLVQDVLLKRYGLEEGKKYTVAGVPKSVEAARDLFAHDPRQFQHWAVELARGFASAKFSGDRGIDGRIHFETNEGLKNMVISVKGGNKPTPVWMRELSGVVQREEDTRMGGLICLETPTRGMLEEVTRGGIYSYLGTNYHRLQIRTIQDLLDGNWFDTPSTVRTLGKTSQTIMPM